MKNHIFFSHYLALRRKCGKRVGILCSNSAAVLAGHGLPLPLQRKNQSSRMLESSRKNVMMAKQTSPTPRGSRVGDRLHEMVVIGRYRERKGGIKGWRGRAPSADTPMGGRHDLHSRRSGKGRPEDNEKGRKFILGRANKQGKGTNGLSCFSVYIMKHGASYRTKRLKKKMTGHRLATLTCP